MKSLPARLTGLAVHPGQVALGAELLQFETVGRIAPILLCDVVSLLANLAGEGDFRANILSFASHGIFLTFGLVGEAVASLDISSGGGV